MNYEFGFLQTASSKDEDTGDNKANEMGIVSSHAYSILKVFEMKNGVRIVKMRNPWGETEWKGD